jgi:hypothetical protein
MEPNVESELRWVVTDDEEILLSTESIADVGALLHELRSNPHGQLTLWERKGEVANLWSWRNLLSRLTGPAQTHIMHFDLSWITDVAAIIFYDVRGREYRVIADSAIQPSIEIRRHLSFGEVSPLGLEYCLPKERAFDLAQLYTRDTQIPTEARYNFVR